MTPDLQQLLDKQSLHELTAAYCRAVDRRDFALLESLYHPLAQHDHGGLFSGSVAQFIPWLINSLAGISTSHFVGNTLFAVDGDSAEGEIYTINYHLLTDGEEYIAGGRYLDHYRRGDDGWRIWRRKRVIDWTQRHAAREHPLGDAIGVGVAGPGDPSYQWLQRLSAARW